MYKVKQIPTPSESNKEYQAFIAAIENQTLYKNFDLSSLNSHAPDVHLVAFDEKDTAVARCSLWWTNVPELPGECMAAIGHYAASSDEPAATLLKYAQEIAKEQKATCLIGPLDGNTWRSYRFVTESHKVESLDNKTVPPYFLEPQNPETYPLQFEKAGFKPLATYSSAINLNLGEVDTRINKAVKRFSDQGIRIRTLDVENYDAELKQIFQLSLESFVHNYLYTPINEQQFLGQYKKVQSLVSPELVLLAQDSDNNLLGYIFALPDIAQQMRAETVDTIIVKTVAVRQNRKSKGLGSVLVSEVQKRAHKLGFKKAIHALMHDSNTSNNISRHYAQTIRRYTLFKNEL